ncbi:MAG: peptidase M23 [Bacteroidetes bacterium]|nr:peptidase M23 [Bacteroidota bacterium]
MKLKSLQRQFLSVCAVLAILLVSNSAFGQSKRTRLENEIKTIEAEIKYTNELLNSTRQNRQNTLAELQILNSKIQKRERLINTIKREIDGLTSEIGENEAEITKLEKELEVLKEEYANLIYYAYKNKDGADRLMFIFSANDFNQAFQRMKYLQYYTSYRKNQGILIERVQDTIQQKNDQLNKDKDSKETYLVAQNREVNALNQEKRGKDQTVSQLQKRERNLRSTIRKKEREANQLNKQIKDIIEAEIKAAAEAAAKAKTTDTNRPTKTAASVIALTPEERQLSSRFYNNKGKLPWPSMRGIISSTFGEHPHPVLKKVRIKNNGIDILTNRGEKARSVFKGKVISVRTITNTNKAVIIRHGDYFTVYSNLSQVYVNTGDEVETKQDLGVVYTDRNSAKTELHFEIWKGKTLLNPASWIAKGQ